MKGYKGMDANMCCRGKQYEISKTYVEDKAKLCKSGMHFCKNLCDVFYYYAPYSENRFFEVEANEISTDGIKSVADTLTIVRELEPKEVNRSIYGNGYGNCNGYMSGDGWGDGNICGDLCGNGRGRGLGYNNGYFGVTYGSGKMRGSEHGNGIGCGNGDSHIQGILIFCD